jgi:hypothetical protein
MNRKSAPKNTTRKHMKLGRHTTTKRCKRTLQRGGVACEEKDTFEYKGKRYCFLDKEKLNNSYEKTKTSEKGHYFAYTNTNNKYILVNLTANQDLELEPSILKVNSLDGELINPLAEPKHALDLKKVRSPYLNPTADINEILTEIISEEIQHASNNTKKQNTNIVFIQYKTDFYLVQFNSQNQITKLKKIPPFPDCQGPHYLINTAIKLCINSDKSGKLYMHFSDATNTSSSKTQPKSIMKKPLSDSITEHQFNYNIDKVYVYFLPAKYNNIDEIEIIEPETADESSI